MKYSTEDHATLKRLEEDHFRDITEFTFQFVHFKINAKLRTFFNKMFSAKNHTANKDGHLDWSGDEIILINDAGKVVHLSNSEWASFKYL